MEGESDSKVGRRLVCLWTVLGPLGQFFFMVEGQRMGDAAFLLKVQN